MLGGQPIKYARPMRPDAICITTNGFVKSDGKCVMGRGCAAQAKKMFPTIDMMLGSHIKSKGNVPGVIGASPYGWSIVSFPVKPKGVKVATNCANLVEHMRDNFSVGDIAPGWAAKADPVIIQQSAIGLKILTDRNNWKIVILPRPGCGAGELQWEEVRPILAEVLDDRFYAITF